MYKNRFKWVRTVTVLLPPSLLVFILVKLALWFDRRWDISIPDWLSWAGWVFLIAGLSFVTAAEISFFRLGSATGAIGDAPRQLVTGGIYRYSRNPIYVGAMLILAGLALVLQSPNLLLFTLVFSPAMIVYVVKVEEPYLLKRFGAEYAAYCRQVPRWLPVGHAATRRL